MITFVGAKRGTSFNKAEGDRHSSNQAVIAHINNFIRATNNWMADAALAADITQSATLYEAEYVKTQGK